MAIINLIMIKPTVCGSQLFSIFRCENMQKADIFNHPSFILSSHFCRTATNDRLRYTLITRVSLSLYYYLLSILYSNRWDIAQRQRRQPKANYYLAQPCYLNYDGIFCVSGRLRCDRVIKFSVRSTWMRPCP